MRPLHRKNMSEQSHPAGFTLIELLVVVSIIAVLIGLTVAVLGKSKQTAEEAVVRAEISAFDSAFATFNSTFYRNPPSRIVLYEAATGAVSWATDGASGSATDIERARSRVLIRELWSDFNFGMNRDINGDGDMTDKLTLTGAECLCFFLGGVPQRDVAGVFSTAGFSKNPANPFALPPAGGTNGFSPLFEFKPARLVDVDGDLMPEYVDGLTELSAPYVYASSYNGAGYQVADLVVGTPSDLTDVYRQNAAGKAWKSSSYQIISAGADGQYGPGGLYDAANTNNLAQATRDNMTNFHNGLLAK